jgi:diacylglycerol kinase family enzyme
MRRKDGKKIPNGTGDDTCGSFGIDIGDINQALEFLIKGNTIKVDVIKILIDFESEKEIIDS